MNFMDLKKSMEDIFLLVLSPKKSENKWRAKY